ncbi:MAG: amidohydrolase family protein [Pseudomonadota bacterium]
MIDAHHHIWLQKDLPWLLGPEQPRIFGAYGAIKRDYTIDEYLSDLDGTGIEKSVYVQANWAPNWAEDEVAWVQATADRTGWPHGIVGYADFTLADLRPTLERFAKYPLLKGFRQQFHWHHNPQYRFAPGPKQLAEPQVARNIAVLADYGWSFDLQVFPGQMDDAAKLAQSCPDVTFILQHAGMLTETTKAAWTEWRDGMKRLADCENVTTKLSAFGTFIHRNDPDFIAKIIGETLAIFPADRAMFGSNFPIEKIWTDYRSLLDAFLNATAGLPKGQQKSIFNDTARRVYRLE